MQFFKCVSVTLFLCCFYDSKNIGVLTVVGVLLVAVVVALDVVVAVDEELHHRCQRKMNWMLSLMLTIPRFIFTYSTKS